MSKLIPEVCEAICLCSFSSATLSIDTPRKHFHLVDKLITAREFNAHVRPARTKYKGYGLVNRRYKRFE